MGRCGEKQHPRRPLQGGFAQLMGQFALQVHHRANECSRALQLFRDISRGNSIPNVLPQGFDLSVLKVPGAAGLAWVLLAGRVRSCCVKNRKMPSLWCTSFLQDSIDLAKAAVMGHSFGGVTAVLALVKEPGFRWVALGCCPGLGRPQRGYGHVPIPPGVQWPWMHGCSPWRTCCTLRCPSLCSSSTLRSSRPLKVWPK